MERISRYQLQLDSMDLNYLPISSSRDFTKTAPIWSFGSDSNEYFEFEIRKKVDDNIQDSTITATCYICDIEVPKLFFKDHCKSKRHYINKCIAETALDRMKKHLQNKDCEITNDVSDTYFCPECIVTVSQKDQKTHEKLQSHKYLAMFDTLFENLYKIYANESDIKNTEHEADISHITDTFKSDSIKLDFDSNDSMEYKTGNIYNKRLPDEPNVSLDHLKLNRYSILELKGLDSSDTSHIGKTNDVLKSKEIVSEESKSKSNFTSIPFDKDSVVNKEVSDYISEDGDNFNCNVCYSTFNKNALNSHINGSRHKMNMVSSVHYMMKESGNDLYCIVCCNILENSVKSAREHCKGANHTMLYKKILKENGIRLTRSRIYCELCDKTINRRNEFVHIFGCKQHHKKRSNSSLCSVCDIIIPNNEVKNHEHSDFHKTRLECKQDKFINGINKAINNIIRNDETMEDTSSNETKIEPYFCVICLVNVPNSAKNIEMHNNGASHRKKAQQYSEIIVVPESSVNSEVNEANSLYYCDICQCSLLNNINMIVQHNTGASHLKKLKKINDSLDTTKELPTSKQGEKKAEIVCKVCKVRLPNTKKNISEHGKGKVHLNNYKITLESENIVSDDNKHYCQACNIYIIENPLKHIEEKSHKNKNKLLIKNLSFKKTLNGDETTNQLSVTETHVAEESILVKTDSTMDLNCSASGVKTQDLIPLVSGYNMYNENLSDPQKIDSCPSHTDSDKITVLPDHDSKSPLKIKESNTKIPSSLKEKPNVVKDDEKLLKNEWITILDGEYYCKICSTSLQNVKKHISERMHQYLHPRFPY
ncbi:unnamed protein product [Pieris brassicae]|uniref:U1-type domain-containing protein n=1 Tax=Pieris brassicae TaxID=7116 RepID=A0A9P0TJ82_PIEBR|nr:unnamed protein product [Pieris brassicae]